MRLVLGIVLERETEIEEAWNEFFARTNEG
jgi:hypothetical protein